MVISQQFWTDKFVSFLSLSFANNHTLTQHTHTHYIYQGKIPMRTFTTCLILLLSLTSWTLAQDSPPGNVAPASSNTTQDNAPSSSSGNNTSNSNNNNNNKNSTQGGDDDTPQNLTIITPDERRPKNPNATAPGFGDKFANPASRAEGRGMLLLTGGLAAYYYYH